MVVMARKTKNSSLLWRILIAEDDLKACEQLAKSLSKIAKCRIATNGQEALNAYEEAIQKKNPFDFIILDVTMPLIDGFGVLKTIRAKEESAQEKTKKCACIIMITAYKDSLMERYNMGWDEYITKPVNPEMLIAKMNQLMPAKQE